MQPESKMNFCALVPKLWSTSGRKVRQSQKCQEYYFTVRLHAIFYWTNGLKKYKLVLSISKVTSLDTRKKIQRKGQYKESVYFNIKITEITISVLNDLFSRHEEALFSKFANTVQHMVVSISLIISSVFYKSSAILRGASL